MVIPFLTTFVVLSLISYEVWHYFCSMSLLVSLQRATLHLKGYSLWAICVFCLFLGSRCDSTCFCKVWIYIIMIGVRCIKTIFCNLAITSLLYDISSSDHISVISWRQNLHSLIRNQSPKAKSHFTLMWQSNAVRRQVSPVMFSPSVYTYIGLVESYSSQVFVINDNMHHIY